MNERNAQVAQGLMKTLLDTAPTASIGAPDVEQYSTGARRESVSYRYDLIPPEALEVLADVLGEGARKYSPRNWEQGLPVSNCINHMLAHLVEWQKGDVSENHISHFLWNAMAAVVMSVRHYDNVHIVDGCYAPTADAFYGK